MATADAKELKPHEVAKKAKEQLQKVAHIDREVARLDEFASGIRKRHHDAQEALLRLKWEFEEQQKSIGFMEEAREKLAAEIAFKKKKAAQLRVSLRREEKRYHGLVGEIKGAARLCINGSDTQLGLRKVTAKLQSQDLADLRGYSCGVGTTTGASGAPVGPENNDRTQLPRLGR
mmetsp:Transcript_56295/g.131921  ORF Transcript_56295/g.131921 Transcript_56295/m.131921 type:complete len:175 (-) Transcript_56295:91-615(-)